MPSQYIANGLNLLTAAALLAWCYGGAAQLLEEMVTGARFYFLLTYRPLLEIHNSAGESLSIDTSACNAYLGNHKY